MIAASVLTTSVITNSTKPGGQQRRELDVGGLAEAAGDQGDDAVAVPISRTRGLITKTGETISRTAMVSPERPAEAEHACRR